MVLLARRLQHRLHGRDRRARPRGEDVRNAPCHVAERRLAPQDLVPPLVRRCAQDVEAAEPHGTLVRRWARVAVLVRRWGVERRKRLQQAEIDLLPGPRHDCDEDADGDERGERGERDEERPHKHLRLRLALARAVHHVVKPVWHDRRL